MCTDIKNMTDTHSNIIAHRF